MYLTKDVIERAVEQSKEIEKKYPDFYKVYKMLLDLNQGIIDNPGWEDEFADDTKFN